MTSGSWTHTHEGVLDTLYGVLCTLMGVVYTPVDVLDTLQGYLALEKTPTS